MYDKMIIPGVLRDLRERQVNNLRAFRVAKDLGPVSSTLPKMLIRKEIARGRNLSYGDCTRAI